ncbi:MAG TPA: hypothetical protein VFT22_03540 [Kofleriaceae bacterium]|nr:hypothetical protein [Kofleriaceae bacterium]
MTDARPLRVLLVANDGFSAGHVVRTLAIARGLARQAMRRGIALRPVLATTSEAHGLLAGEPLAIVRLPGPAAARRAGLSDVERRRLVRATLEGVAGGLGPDLVVVDTFPSGPHGELAGLAGLDRLDRLAPGARRAVIRRAIPEASQRHAALTAGLDDCDLAVLAGDPTPQPVALSIPTRHVPPILLDDAGERLDRAAARAALGLSGERAILVAAGGGGDREAAARAVAIARAIVVAAPDATPVLALGPLAPEPAPDAGPAIRTIRIAPLSPLLAAFDGAFAPAGYNTAHELARARVPAALFARPRPFDDQAGRAARFAAAGFARVLASVPEAEQARPAPEAHQAQGAPEPTSAIAAALAWMQSAQLPELAGGGADRAAEALLDLATGRVTDEAAGPARGASAR